MNIYLHSILYNNSLVDGPGLRTVLFLQGCDLQCPGCHNQQAWKLRNGNAVDIDALVLQLEKEMINKKITISGGEPLLQTEEVLYLIDRLFAKNFDIAFYTGHNKEDVPAEIISKIKYLKTGPFEENLKTSTRPFVGSKNQIFEELLPWHNN